jgi:carbonic anhydrase
MLLFFLSLLSSTLSYNYINHGLDWPGLCNSSFSQSPIDINRALLVQVPCSDTQHYWYLDLYYSAIHVINLNSTSSSPVTSGFAFNPSLNFEILGNFGNLTLQSSSSSKQYLTSAVRVHYPAEHTFNGASPANSANLLELQIEHVSADNSTDVLMLSLLFQASAQSNFFLQQVIDSFYSSLGGDLDCTFATNGWFVVKNFYTYQGSQTRPDCREGVTWVINSDVINATAAQIAFFSSRLNTSASDGNYRYTMPQNGRTVYQHTCPVFSKARNWAGVIFGAVLVSAL